MKGKNIRHYEDLSENDVLYGYNNYWEKEELLKKLVSDKEKLDNKIHDLKNYLDVIGRVTHIYENVPVIESYEPYESDIADASYSLSTVTLENQRKTEAFLLPLSDDKELKKNWKNMWCLQLEDYLLDTNPDTNEKGLNINFIKFISYKYIIKKVKCEDIINNLPIYYEEFLER